MDLNEKLKQMEGMYAEGKDQPVGAPDGVYSLQLQDCKLTESQTSGNPMVVREHLILEGEYQGEVIRDYIVLKEKRDMRRLADFFRKMGQEPPDSMDGVKELIDLLASTNPIYTAKLRLREEFYNVDIQELVEASPSTEAPAAEPSKPAKSPSKQSAAPAPFKVGDLVLFESEGTEYEAKVSEMRETDAAVVDNTGETWVVDLVDLKPAPAAPPAKSPKKASKQTASEPDPKLVALKTFAASYSIEVNDAMDVRAVVAALGEYEWQESELLPEEAALLKDCGVPTIAPVKSPKSPKKAGK